jgi:hypothetical protein
MSEQIPIPVQALEVSKKIKATNTINKLQLENILLKHLVETIDPEHDYIMDLGKMTLEKVKKDGKPIQSSPREETPRRESGDTGDQTRRLDVRDRRSFAGPVTGKDGDGV